MLTRNQWIAELRSGRWQQHRQAITNIQGTAFCCLGVACAVDQVEKLESTNQVVGHLPDELLFQEVTPPEELPMRLQVDRTLYWVVQGLNDDLRWSFAQIADWVEANTPEEVQ